MDPTTAIGSAFAAFGLSGAAGLNAWLPLLAGALLHRLGVVELAAPFDALSSTLGLLVLTLAFAADFVGDKVPAVDHLLHTAGLVVHPLAGAALFVGQSGVGGELPAVVAAVAGAIVAGTVHTGRASVRPASTATTAGAGNPVLSLAEDVGAGVLTALAFLLPVLAALAVLALLAALVVLWRRLGRRIGVRRPAA